eukprot:CAMPEP_0168242988 /NCGR_PEP_ID=MMETSP0140_2-20121125/23762_1 /TAXON_ID=44445 /ORGANISM="Pseudo-nitzschia australis, Strain 10249 10 AB" /LENGTH=62 /DNA_ID=CAMNT_0008178223 /DNA_START=281 /DNA_END=465 /DNA_ORIENTATION=+
MTDPPPIRNIVVGNSGVGGNLPQRRSRRRYDLSSGRPQNPSLGPLAQLFGGRIRGQSAAMLG